MAVINGLYIHVKNEGVMRSVDATDHPVDQGIPTTDTVRAQAMTISLNGKIVDYGGMKASQVIAKLKAWQESGSLIEFRGRNVASNMQIRSFDTTQTNANSGGADFTMELKEVRIAKSSYTPKKTSTAAKKKAAKKDTSTIKVGSKVVFGGGPVYVSSDAKKAAATRGKSTCKVTKISNASYSVHPYHVISTDGKNVYGWVDKSIVQNTETTSTSGKTNAGTQQVKASSTSNSKKSVYHTVKKGDTVYALVNKYKAGKSVSWVISNNPKAFSRKGDATTLQIGKKLLMGYK